MMSISKSYLMMAISIVIITNFIYFQPQSYTSQLKFFEAKDVPERSGAEAEALHIVYNEAAAAFAKVVNEAEAMLKVYKEAAVASGKAEADAKAAAKRAEAAAAKAKAEGTTPAAAKAKVEADGKVIAKRAEEDAAAKTKAEAEGTAAVKRVEEEAADKELVIEILKEAGVTDEEINEYLQEIPTWSQITNLYGSKPIVLGTETCQHYRATVAKEKMVLALAGLFNTGTNAMATSLQGNIRNRFIAGQVPWWKHNFASRRYNYTGT